MIAKQYWDEHEADFIAEIKDVSSAAEMLEACRRFTSGLKAHVLSCYRQNAVLQQMIALLFAENELGSELLLVREEPSVVLRPSQGEKKKSLRERVLLNPILLYALLAAGMIVSLFSGIEMWPCALFFAAAAGVAYMQNTAPRSAQPQYQPRAAFSPELTAAHIARQVQQLDAHIDDLQALLKEMELPGGDLPVERDTLSLCQLVWANAHQGYPAESMLLAAEQTLKRNGLEWVEFSEETRSCYQIMPTRKTARVVYPALRKIEDGALVCKGQYLEEA